MVKFLVTGVLFLLVELGLFLLSANECWAQSRVRTVDFSFVPEKSDDPYNQRIKQNTLAVGAAGFVLLAKKSGNTYSVGYYDLDLKKIWETTLPLTNLEEVEAFTRNDEQVLVLTHKQDKEAGSQTLTGYRIDLKTGKQTEAIKLAEAPAKSRRIGVSYSADGSKLVIYAYQYQQAQLKEIKASLFDGNLTKIKDQTYNLNDLVGTQSATIKIDNDGNQYVALITNNATKLSIRRYSNTAPAVKGMDIQVGGVFEGRKVYLFDSFFELQQDGSLYAAVMCADEKTGDFYSLKVIKFDFSAGDMKFAPEFRFTPQYIADINKLNKTGASAVKRLEDIYLSEIVVSPEKNVLVLAEKKYNEGPKLPFAAREIHLFTYDEYLNPTWHSVVNKSQSAPATEGFTSISYKAHLINEELHLVTLETQNGKKDLYSRKINIKSGNTAPAKPLGLNLATDQQTAYLKDFTTWLDDKTMVALVRPAKKGKGLQLSKITFR